MMLQSERSTWAAPVEAAWELAPLAEATYPALRARSEPVSTHSDTPGTQQHIRSKKLNEYVQGLPEANDPLPSPSASFHLDTQCVQGWGGHPEGNP